MNKRVIPRAFVVFSVSEMQNTVTITISLQAEATSTLDQDILAVAEHAAAIICKDANMVIDVVVNGGKISGAGNKTVTRIPATAIIPVVQRQVETILAQVEEERKRAEEAAFQKLADFYHSVVAKRNAKNKDDPLPDDFEEIVNRLIGNFPAEATGPSPAPSAAPAVQSDPFGFQSSSPVTSKKQPRPKKAAPKIETRSMHRNRSRSPTRAIDLSRSPVLDNSESADDEEEEDSEMFDFIASSSSSEAEEVGADTPLKSAEKQQIVRKYGQEWEPLFPYFEEFANQTSSEWQQDLDAYKKAWNTNKFFQMAKTELLRMWQRGQQSEKQKDYTEATLMELIWKDHENIGKDVVEMIKLTKPKQGICHACHTKKPLSWKASLMGQDRENSRFYGACCGRRMDYVFQFLGWTSEMIFDKQQNPVPSERTVLRWWCDLVSVMKKMRALALK